MILYKQTKGAKLNCIFLPGIPGRIKDFKIFDDLIKNYTNVYFHIYPGTNNTKGTFDISSAEQSIHTSIKKLTKKNKPLIIIAYSFSTFLLLKLDLSQYNNIAGIFLMSPITGLDKRSIAEDFYKTLISLEKEKIISTDLLVWKMELRHSRLESINESIEKLSQLPIPTIFAYSENDKIIKSKNLEVALNQLMDKEGYGSFLIVKSKEGDHRIDTYHSPHLTTLITILRVQEELKNILGNNISVYCYGSFQFSAFNSATHSDIDLLVIAEDYLLKYQDINSYIDSFNKTSSYKLDISLNEPQDFLSKRLARYNRGPILLHMINELYFSISNKHIFPNPKRKDILHDAYQANLINMRDAQKKICRLNKNDQNCRKIVKYFVYSVLYLLYTRGHKNIDMNHLATYLNKVGDNEIRKNVLIAIKILASNEPTYTKEELYNFVLSMQNIVHEQEVILGIKYEAYQQ